ncbi:MAG: hypothetical protein ACLQEQ_09070 [Nitrososphaerales archaeon]
MIAGPEGIRELFERKEREFMLAKSKVKMRSSVENLDAGDYRIGGLAEGQSVELPRWIAEELVDLKLAETQEERFEDEMSRALSKEKMMGPLQLSILPPDFYMRMRRRLVTLGGGGSGEVKKEDFEKIRNACYDIIGMRLSKLLSLSSSSSQGSSLTDRLAPEEEAFFSVSQSLSKDWRAALLGGAT